MNISIYVKILCKSIINNKNNQQNIFVTLIDTRLVTSWLLLVRPTIKSSNFRWKLRKEKTEENWSERLLLKVYIVVCYFSLIIFSTVEVTSFATRFASCARYNNPSWVLGIGRKVSPEDHCLASRRTDFSFLHTRYGNPGFNPEIGILIPGHPTQGKTKIGHSQVFDMHW